MRHHCDYDVHLGRCRDSDYTAYALFLIARGIEDLVLEVRKLRHGLTNKIERVEIKVMPKSIQVGQSATAHVTALKADGSLFSITSADSVSLAAAVGQDVTFGTPVFNTDGSVDIPVTGVNVDAGDAITAMVDGITSNSDTLTITAAGPSAVQLTLQ